MSKTLTVSEASRSFSDLINRVRYQGESAVLLKNGKPVAKIIPVQETFTGKELAEAWAKMPHLGHEEATLLEADIVDARKALPKLKNKWE